MIEEIWKHNQKSWRKVAFATSFGVLFLALLDLSIGSVYIPPIEIIKALFGNGRNEIWNSIVIEFRLPKTLTAILVGIALSLSGLIMQTLFRNPLAGPFVLGISSGASLGVAILVMGTAILPLAISGLNTVVAACLGSLIVLAIILAMANKLRDTTSLLILGLMFGSAVGASVSILQYFSNPEAIQGYLFWTFGSLSGVTWDELSLFIPIILIGLIATISISSRLNVLNLGDDYALSSGINLHQTRYIIIGITSLLAGVTTAFCGPIAFIGIAVPHITRLISNTSNHNQLTTLVAFIGAGVMLICDIISQLPGLPQSLPINAVTSIFGAPLIIWLIIRRRKMVAF